jgi:hypothetical protein
MTFEATILELTERGARVRIGTAEMWLPRTGPGIEWIGDVEIDGMAYLRAPKWLIAKHRALSELQYQRSMALHHPGGGLDSTKAQGALPMADDRPNQGHGALFRVKEKHNERGPDYTGDLTLPSGEKLELAGWLKETKDGRKHLSISSKPFRARQDETQRERYDQRREREQDDRERSTDEPMPF